jgi:hypothetical protein
VVRDTGESSDVAAAHGAALRFHGHGRLGATSTRDDDF